ncbi:SPOR domain-containing protein [bacterium]|nr:SPOR domain-containing protein [bacterium]
MNNDESLVLDLDDGASMDVLPDATPFCAPRPKKPWLLMGIGVVVIILATYIIVRTIGSGTSSSIDVDLDAPVPVVAETMPPVDTIAVPPMPEPGPVIIPEPQPAPMPAPQPMQPAPAPKPVVAPQPAPVPGTPVRVIEDRKDVTFNPDKAPAVAPAPKPVAKPAPKPAVKPAPKPAPKKQVAAVNGSWFVQFGSYSTRAAAESAQRKLVASHSGLLKGKQFVILAAVLKDGTTTYRLRIAFATSADANGFCRNAKSDGLDCYVAR